MDLLILNITIYIYIYIYIYKLLWVVFGSNIEQVLVTTPHETPTVRPLASHHENYTG